jgi:serine/threonine protein kinase
LSEEHGAVLCDFGLSRESNLLKPTASGTPWYIPLEYITVSERGQPSDVFALGVTLLYLKKLRPAPEFTESRVYTITHIYSLRREVRQASRNIMMSWLAKVEAARAQLELSSTEAFILWEILSPKATARPTATEMVKSLNSELYRRSHRPQVKKKTSDRVAGERERGESQKLIDHGSTTEENESIK